MLDQVKNRHEKLCDLQMQLFKFNIHGSSLKSDSVVAILETTATAKELMQEVDDVLTDSKTAAKQIQAWLTLNKVQAA
jgi:hypothetical protein